MEASMDETFQNNVEIILRWRNLHHLLPVYSSIHNIPERVNEYNTNLFVVFNTMKQKYEIHSIEHGAGMDSYQCTVPYDRLDVRITWYLWENDLRVHGNEIFKRIEQGEQDHEKRNKRKFHNWAQDVASETRTMIAADLGWQDGGKLQHQVQGVKPSEATS
jgi:hypothetical protein